ncbi:3'-5' exonuclease [Sphingobacterium sp. UT-1RO-CII-1]|uniref:3'-5' exonuclease n=1 Tax=Sphingobacterium sp. UT-1RO-CII-1 TaxID=2995225 RepID=UPI00227D1869|nr:3'-5' exonuclease [Sphingobacterium sp. UT-1RO-CII-1]MCY4781687.1 3'-5' exonuclease [Sphingobacterium sp. UT-1RO-CII-1]
MAKLFFYDLETTGLDHERNGIHQISGVIEIDGVVRGEFNYKVKPHYNDQIDPKALDISGVSKDDIMKYPDIREVYSQIIGVIGSYINKYDSLDKFHLVGYNNRGFDDKFFRQFFHKNLDKFFGSYFWSDSVDVMVLASNNLLEQRPMLENFKLSTVASHLGILFDEEKLHDALYDVKLTRDIYHKINNTSCN